MGSLRRGGAVLDYDDLGAGAPAMLFVHGWCGDRTLFAPQVEQFRRNHRVVAVDRVGHGRSRSDQDRDQSVTRHADDLAFVCEQLGLHRPVVVVHSMDRIGLDLAGRYPELVGGLVIIDGPTLAPGYEAQGRGLLGGLRSAAYREVIRGFVEQVAFLPTEDTTVRERVLAVLLGTPQRVAVDSWAGFLDHDPVPAIRAITAPVLHVRAVFPADLERFARLCPQLRTATMAGAGHFAPLTAPDRVNAIIAGFVASSVGTAGPRAAAAR